MKIIYQTKEKTMSIPIPNALLFNSVTSKMLENRINKYSRMEISPEQLKLWIKILGESVHEFGHYTLVEVKTSDDEVIKIIM